MSVPTPRDIEMSLYSNAQFGRLRGAVDDDLVAEAVFELTRSGAVIADYAIRSGEQRANGDAAVFFGFYLRSLWRSGPASTGAQSIGVAWLDRSIVTIAAFAGDDDGSGREKNSDHDRVLSDTRDILERMAGGGRAARLVELGRSVGRRLGYAATEMASRARRPWDALESLTDVVDDQVLLPDLLFEGDPAIFDSVAGSTDVSLQSFRRDAMAWNDRRPRREASLSHSAGGPSDLSMFIEESRQDDNFLALSSTPEGLGGLEFRVWYGTDRRLADTGAPRFLNERDPNDQLHFGTCLVNIPESHQFGTTQPGWFRRWTRWGRGGRIALDVVDPSDRDSFILGIRRALAVDGSDRTALVFVHGFANSFAGAAVKAAQLGCDLKINGITAMFSWPSHGSPFRYKRDGLRVEQSEDNFVNFIELLATRCGIDRVDVIAHSMGGRLLSRAIGRIQARLDVHGMTLGTVVLAAPDVDVALFRSLSPGYRRACQKASIYVSDRDRALRQSLHYWGASRVGLAPPVTVAKDFDTIDVSGVDFSIVGHGYYAASRGVLLDIHSLLNGSWDPNRRPQLAARTGTQGSWWEFV